MNCWAILFCNKWWIIDLSPCFQQSDLHSVYLPFYFIFKEKPARNWLTYFSCGYAQFHLGWISETTHFLILKDWVSIWKNNIHYGTGAFFHWDHSFPHHYHLWGKNPLQHLENLFIFTHITRNTYAVSQGVMDRKNGALHSEPRWAAYPYPMKETKINTLNRKQCLFSLMMLTFG